MEEPDKWAEKKGIQVDKQWLTDPLWLGLLAALGAGFATAGRRLGLVTRHSKKWSFWQRVRHAFSGAVLAATAGAGAAMIAADLMAPPKVLGTVLLAAACFDLSTSEGLAWLAETYLRSRPRDRSANGEPDDSALNGG